MSPSVSVIWNHPAPQWFWKEMNVLLTPETCRGLFFRADDVGDVDDRFVRMISLFRAHQAKLALAVVPDWIRHGAPGLRQCCPPGDSLFTWHMHGATHLNHALSGKKSEWCAERSREEKRRSLLWGRDVLKRVLGEAPKVFTPPWNRCDAETLCLLSEVGFTGISRDHAPSPTTPPELTSFDICIDLHTRKEAKSNVGWRRLQTEFEQGIARADCGIMLHHERMNEAAFHFLEILLARIQALKVPG